VKAEDMLSGVKRYASYCSEKGIVGTQFVKQASSFLGTGEHWSQGWETSAVKADAPKNRDPKKQFIAGVWVG
jgi:hypothetical protein